jgi:hypothetical protein
MCAIDTISAYAYRGTDKWNDGVHIQKFITNHFPQAFKQHAPAICKMYRNCLVHSWNLFEVTLLPHHEAVKHTGGTLSFGLLTFFDGLKDAVANFLDELTHDPGLQKKTLSRYQALKQTARP